MDGHIRIDTRLQTDKLDSDIKEIEKKLDALKKKEKNEIEKDGIRITGVSSLTDEEIEQYNELVDTLNKLRSKKYEVAEANEKLEQAEVSLGNASKELLDNLNMSSEGILNRWLSDAEKYKQEYNKLVDDFEKKGIDINTAQAQDELYKSSELFKSLRELIKERFGIDIGEIREVEDSTANIKFNVEEIKNSLNNIGTSVQKTAKKVLKWGLAIFSVRSAYMFIRQAASTLSQYNEDLKNKIESIRLALASALEPVIKRLVDWVIILLRYINAISMALFKWDLFKNAKNMKSMSKSAKEIKNSLAGFDEMNMLSNSSSGTGGSNFDYNSLYFGEEKPGWIEWIDKNADKIKDFLAFVLAFGISLKALNLVKELTGLTGLKLWGIIAALALTLKGIYDTVKGIIDFVKDPSWDNFSKVLTGISEILIGIGIALAIIFASNPVGWIMIIIGAVGMLTAYLIKNRNEIKENFINKLESDFKNLSKNLKPIVEGIVKIFNGDLKGGLTSIVKALVNNLIGFINKLITGINLITTPIRGMIIAIGKVLGKNYTMSNIKIPSIPKLAQGGIVNRPTYAQIGEAGREAVLPLDRNTEWMNELAKKINSNGGVVNVYLDGRLIQRQYNQRQEEFNFATNGGN